MEERENSQVKNPQVKTLSGDSHIPSQATASWNQGSGSSLDPGRGLALSQRMPGMVRLSVKTRSTSVDATNRKAVCLLLWWGGTAPSAPVSVSGRAPSQATGCELEKRLHHRSDGTPNLAEPACSTPWLQQPCPSLQQPWLFTDRVGRGCKGV